MKQYNEQASIEREKERRKNKQGDEQENGIVKKKSKVLLYIVAC